MTTLIICLLIAIILPYLAKMPLAIAQNNAGGYDNHYPREQQVKLSGFGARAYAAHQNSFESLAVFATAAITALATNHVTDRVVHLAVIYIVARLVYHCFYLMDLALLRSTAWFVSYACCVAILWSCI